MPKPAASIAIDRRLLTDCALLARRVAVGPDLTLRPDAQRLLAALEAQLATPANDAALSDCERQYGRALRDLAPPQAPGVEPQTADMTLQNAQPGPPQRTARCP